jgi:hypothetical protein
MDSLLLDVQSAAERADFVPYGGSVRTGLMSAVAREERCEQASYD